MLKDTHGQIDRQKEKGRLQGEIAKSRPKLFMGECGESVGGVSGGQSTNTATGSVSKIFNLWMKRARGSCVSFCLVGLNGGVKNECWKQLSLT